MSEFTDSLRDDHIAMITRQSVFFVATAAAAGRINLSPKGYDIPPIATSPAKPGILQG